MPYPAFTLWWTPTCSLDLFQRPIPSLLWCLPQGLGGVLQSMSCIFNRYGSENGRWSWPVTPLPSAWQIIEMRAKLSWVAMRTVFVPDWEHQERNGLCAAVWSRVVAGSPSQRTCFLSSSQPCLWHSSPRTAENLYCIKRKLYKHWVLSPHLTLIKLSHVIDCFY